MSLLTRFAKAFTGEDRGADEPSGLIEDQSGRVYYIKPDGSRIEVGGGGSQPAGSYLPTADPVGATFDTTTYDNPITMDGKMAVLVLPRDTAALAIAIEGDAYPRILIGSDPNDAGIGFSDGTYNPYGSAGMWVDGSGQLRLNQYTVPLQSLAAILASSPSAGSHAITNLADPTNDQDAATKKWVTDNPPSLLANQAQEVLVGNPVTVPPSQTAFLPWVHSTNLSLLDLTNPVAPTIKTSGVYGITVSVLATGLDPAGQFRGHLSAGATDQQVDSPYPPGGGEVAILLSTVIYLSATEPISVSVNNFNTGDTSIVLDQAIVQRII